MSVFSEGWIALLTGCATTPYHCFFDSHSISTFQSNLLYKVFFPYTGSNWFHSSFILAFQTITTFFYFHRLGISFPVLFVGFVIWLTKCQMIFHKHVFDFYYWKLHYTAPLATRSPHYKEDFSLHLFLIFCLKHFYVCLCLHNLLEGFISPYHFYRTI